ncbi:MAG TPA: NAD(P)H-dependent oxidoreductase [Vicinamibacterales bacterium]|jgi:multimeric flavodoxin WrbA
MGIETAVVCLGDYHLEPCRGCRACFAKGEEFCPLEDDRGMLLAKMKDADRVVLASPNYCFEGGP